METLSEIIERCGKKAKHIEVFTADNGRRFFRWRTDLVTERDRDDFCGLEEVIDWKLMTIDEYNNTILANSSIHAAEDYGWTDEVDAPILCICVDENKIIPEDDSLVDRLCGGREPCDPCLRWQSGDAVNTICIESGLHENEYDREIELNGIEDGICDVFGCGNDTQYMYRTITDDEFKYLIDICLNDK